MGNEVDVVTTPFSPVEQQQPPPGLVVSIPEANTGRVNFEPPDNPQTALQNAERRTRRNDLDDRLPYDLWIEQVVPWENGGYTAEIYRELPASINTDGRTHNTKGRCGEFSSPPTTQMIADLFGGGKEMRCVVFGPDPSNFGRPKVFGEKRFPVIGDPKPINGIGADGKPLANAEPSYPRGAPVGDQVVIEAMKAQNNAITREQDRAERAHQEITALRQSQATAAEPLLDRALTMAEKVADARVETERAHGAAASNRIQQLEDVIRRLEAKVENDMGGSGNDVVASAMKTMGDVMSAALSAPKQNGSSASSDQLAELERRHARELETERTAAREREASMQRTYDSMAANERTANSVRLEDLRSANKAEVERIKESERDRAAAIVAQKENEIRTLEKEKQELREDLRDARAARSTAETLVGDLKGQVARLDSDLRHAPTSATSPMAQLKEVMLLKTAMSEAGLVEAGGGRRGRRGDDDDDDEKETTMDKAERLLENPLIAGIIGRTFGAVTGDNAEERKKEIAIAQANAEAAKAQAAEAIIKARKNQPAATAKAQTQQQAGTLPVAGQAAAAPARPKHSLHESGDRPLPMVPTKRVLTPEFQPYAKFLLQIEHAVRTDMTAQAFIQQAGQQGMSPEMMAGALLSEYPMPVQFLDHLDAGGVFKAYPAIGHPIGRRWVSRLWSAVKQAAAPSAEA